MLKCFKFDSMPEGLDIKYNEINTEIGIRFLVGPEFKDETESIEFGNVWLVVNIPDDCKDDTDILKLVKASSRTDAFMYTGTSDSFENVAREKLESEVRLKASIAVTFKLPTLPNGFLGEVKRFSDKANMLKVMSDDYIGFERTPECTESGIYYVCAILLEDFQGVLDYDYFVRNLKYKRLIAYYLEEEKGQQITFRYKNKHYDS